MLRLQIYSMLKLPKHIEVHMQCRRILRGIGVFITCQFMAFCLYGCFVCGWMIAVEAFKQHARLWRPCDMLGMFCCSIVMRWPSRCLHVATLAQHCTARFYAAAEAQDFAQVSGLVSLGLGDRGARLACSLVQHSCIALACYSPAGA